MLWFLPIIALSIGFYSSESRVGFLSSVADSTPVLGHVKGALQYALGDRDGGEHAIHAATRTVGVIGGGLVGSLAGPVGMVIGGIAGGVAVDTAATAAKSSIERGYRPLGHYAFYEELKNRQTPKALFEAVAGVVMDGFAGLYAGVIDSGPGKLTRTQWRNHLYKNARARAAGRPLRSPPVHVAVKPSFFGALFGTASNAKTSHDSNDDADEI